MYTVCMCMCVCFCVCVLVCVSVCVCVCVFNLIRSDDMWKLLLVMGYIYVCKLFKGKRSDTE